MTMILAIDPGTHESGVVLYGGEKVIRADVVKNQHLLSLVAETWSDVLAIEMVASYGMAVGAEVFETVFWAGRFAQVRLGHAYELSPSPVRKVYRRDVKLHLCHTARAKDANVRQALIDRFGPGKAAAIGTKAKPGPLHGVSSHAWAALAVAVYVADTMDAERPPA